MSKRTDSTQPARTTSLSLPSSLLGVNSVSFATSSSSSSSTSSNSDASTDTNTKVKTSSGEQSKDGHANLKKKKKQKKQNNKAGYEESVGITKQTDKTEQSMIPSIDKSKNGDIKEETQLVLLQRDSANSETTSTDFPLPDDMSVVDIIHLAGKQFGWSATEIDSDAHVLEKQRLRRVSDLRMLNRDAWARVPLLPIVQIVLERMAWEGVGGSRKTVDKKIKKQQKYYAPPVKRQTTIEADNISSLSVQSAENKFAASPFVQQVLQQQSQEPKSTNGIRTQSLLIEKLLEKPTVSQDVLTRVEQHVTKPQSDFNADLLVQQLLNPPLVSSTVITSSLETNLLPSPTTGLVDSNAISKPLTFDNMTAAEMVHLLLYHPSQETTKNSESNTIDNHSITEADVLSENSSSKPALGIVIANPNRIRVSNGRKVYELDRWCPHKHYDMLKAPPMLAGSNIIRCPKHDWDFDLDNNGTCVTRKNKSLHACVAFTNNKELQW